jgi:hypothetical protein
MVRTASWWRVESSRGSARCLRVAVAVGQGFWGFMSTTRQGPGTSPWSTLERVRHLARLTVTVPPSGEILVKWISTFDGSANGVGVYAGVMIGATMYDVQYLQDGAEALHRKAVVCLITGLTPGASVNLDAAVSSGGAATVTSYNGNGLGPLIIEAWDPTPSPYEDTFVFDGFLEGALTVHTGVRKIRNDTGRDLTLLSVRGALDVAPTGSDAILDVHKNGTTIFTTQANRPTFAIGSDDTGKVTNMDVVTWLDTQYLTLDVDQIGSTVAGSDLQFQVVARG